MARGPQALADHELLAILLNTGIKGKSVSSLAMEVLETLDRQQFPSIEDLAKLNGMGASKAAAIIAMLEFGRRHWGNPGLRIIQPGDIFKTVAHFADRRQERFICLSLNGAHEVLASRVVTVGLVNKTIVHPREVFADPILDRAIAVAVAHNHPSGLLEPSEEDDEITWRLEESAEILGLRFLDHVIFSETAFFSYREQNRLE
jgi:DNA repair protein RadC